MVLNELVNEYGEKNLRFFLPVYLLLTTFPSFSWVDPDDQKNQELVEFTIDQSRYRVRDGYKIGLKSLDWRYEVNPYYILDLKKLIREDPNIRVCILHGDGYTRIPNEKF